ncbi:MAG: hypothetical protein Alis3KO_05150 [Aliiglaciecola sp.]
MLFGLSSWFFRKGKLDVTLVTVGLATLMRDILNRAWSEQQANVSLIQHYSTLDEFLRIGSEHPPEVIVVESSAEELLRIHSLLPVSNVLRILDLGKSFEWHRPHLPMVKYGQLTSEQLIHVILMAQP